MKINTNFNNNIIPYDYAAGAQPVDLINNNPIKSFPFNVVDLPPGTQYIAWTLIDYDAVPVCVFPWIHWVVANVSVNSDTIDIVENFSRIKGDFVQGKNSFATGLLAEDFSEIENHYVGPTPPDKNHYYELIVYALSEKLNLKNTFYLNELLHQVDSKLLDKAKINLIGRKV